MLSARMLCISPVPLFSLPCGATKLGTLRSHPIYYLHQSCCSFGRLAKRGCLGFGVAQTGAVASDTPPPAAAALASSARTVESIAQTPTQTSCTAWRQSKLVKHKGNTLSTLQYVQSAASQYLRGNTCWCSLSRKQPVMTDNSVPLHATAVGLIYVAQESSGRKTHPRVLYYE